MDMAHNAHTSQCSILFLVRMRCRWVTEIPSRSVIPSQRNSTSRDNVGGSRSPSSKTAAAAAGGKAMPSWTEETLEQKVGVGAWSRLEVFKKCEPIFSGLKLKFFTGINILNSEPCLMNALQPYNLGP